MRTFKDLENVSEVYQLNAKENVGNFLKSFVVSDKNGGYGINSVCSKIITKDIEDSVVTPVNIDKEYIKRENVSAFDLSVYHDTPNLNVSLFDTNQTIDKKTKIYVDKACSFPSTKLSGYTVVKNINEADVCVVPRIKTLSKIYMEKVFYNEKANVMFVISFGHHNSASCKNLNKKLAIETIDESLSLYDSIEDVDKYYEQLSSAVKYKNLFNSEDIEKIEFNIRMLDLMRDAVLQYQGPVVVYSKEELWHNDSDKMKSVISESDLYNVLNDPDKDIDADTIKSLITMILGNDMDSTFAAIKSLSELNFMKWKLSIKYALYVRDGNCSAHRGRNNLSNLKKTVSIRFMNSLLCGFGRNSTLKPNEQWRSTKEDYELMLSLTQNFGIRGNRTSIFVEGAQRTLIDRIC